MLLENRRFGYADWSLIHIDDEVVYVDIVGCVATLV
jgi:hypothetical protein